MKLINQHILVMMTLHMKLTFIHVTQGAYVSKLNTDVMITKHSLKYQKYCPDVSNCITICISSAITHTALCNPRQRDGCGHMKLDTWEVTRLIGSGDISYKGASNPLSLNNHTQSPKSLIKSVEIFPKFISYLLVDHTQSVKPLHVSEEKSNEDTLSSPYQAHDTGARNDTWGKCPWLPHHNQCPEVHGKLHEILLGLKDKKRKTLGDNFLKRKETGLKDYKNIKGRYKKIHGKRIQDTFGEKCHREPQHHKGIGRDHKEIDGKMIHDEVVHGNLEENSSCYLRHTGTDDKHRETIDSHYQRLKDKLLPKHVGFDIEISH